MQRERWLGAPYAFESPCDIVLLDESRACSMGAAVGG
jgi:hypothetical protein